MFKKKTGVALPAQRRVRGGRYSGQGGRESAPYFQQGYNGGENVGAGREYPQEHGAPHSHTGVTPQNYDDTPTEYENGGIQHQRLDDLSVEGGSLPQSPQTDTSMVAGQYQQLLVSTEAHSEALQLAGCSSKSLRSPLHSDMDKTGTSYLVEDFFSNLPDKDLQYDLSNTSVVASPGVNDTVMRQLVGMDRDSQHGNPIAQFDVQMSIKRERHIEFVMHGTMKSVVKYFQETYGFVIRHTAWPCLQVVCKILEGQRHSKRLNEKQLTVLPKVTSRRPCDQKQVILQHLCRMVSLAKEENAVFCHRSRDCGPWWSNEVTTLMVRRKVRKIRRNCKNVSNKLGSEEASILPSALIRVSIKGGSSNSNPNQWVPRDQNFNQMGNLNPNPNKWNNQNQTFNQRENPVQNQWSNQGLREKGQEMAGEIIKSPNDHRDYRSLQLPNGLAALLVRDKLSTVAGAAMCVGVGSFSDPSDVPGLAHFVEHMLFMGCDKYPNKSDYMDYISKHGGKPNAETLRESTVYHFDIRKKYLKEALTRLSRFFISPLFDPEMMDREISAVHSEFNGILQYDILRLNQVAFHTAASCHPLNRFTWGNKKSLMDDVKENKIDIHKEVIRFYDKNYDSASMKLVVIGGETLNILQGWVMNLFSDVKQGREKHVKSEETNMNELTIWKFGKLYSLLAVDDINWLFLTWTLPSLHNEYSKKAHEYVSHILENPDGKSSIAYIYQMCMNLTASGYANVYARIGYVYEYIKLFCCDLPKWIFDELQETKDLEFRFAEEVKPDQYAKKLAKNLLLYPEQHIIYGDYVFEVWDEDLIKRILSCLVPKNMRVDISSKTFDKDSKDICKEPWFEKDIPLSLLELWSNPKVNPSFFLPVDTNPFIPRDFALYSENEDQFECITDTPLMKIWYKSSESERVRASAMILITAKGGYKDVKSYILFELFVSLLKDELAEIIFQAKTALSYAGICRDKDQMCITIRSFRGTLQCLLSRIWELIYNFKSCADHFTVKKECMEREVRNLNMEPLAHSSSLLMQVLREKFWVVEDTLICLNSLSFADFSSFIPELLSSLYVEGLCQGNLLKDDVLTISDVFKNINFLPMELRYKEHVFSLPYGDKLGKDVYVKNHSENESVLKLYFQIEQDTLKDGARLSILGRLFHEIVSQPLYDLLRTEKQLCYILMDNPQINSDVLGYSFTIQSSNYNPLQLQSILEEVIDKDLKELLARLDDDTFEEYKSGLSKKYSFDVDTREYEELESISKNDVIQWYETYLRGDSKKRRLLAIRVWGRGTNMEVETPYSSERVITDVEKFKESLYIYSSYIINYIEYMIFLLKFYLDRKSCQLVALDLVLSAFDLVGSKAENECMFDSALTNARFTSEIVQSSMSLETQRMFSSIERPTAAALHCVTEDVRLRFSNSSEPLEENASLEVMGLLYLPCTGKVLPQSILIHDLQGIKAGIQLAISANCKLLEVVVIL
ncbi:hypothetical protein GIB67_012740 [Kingdonia uniflora]|uniref:Nardilysin n=1 Tax=Kingdonia uniflora TaxID=39325 RepID=A0A7J7NFK3_9MAGN|nr:hypothetical protein GIB67_012740 [Kingdonia uniflora]